jgi:hypothetical protein
LQVAEKNENKMPRVWSWNLKIYWSREMSGGNEQNRLNRVLDSILRQDHREFKKEMVQRLLEWGDYLFAYVENDNVLAFAIGVDRPSISHDLWSPHFAEPHGSFHIELVVSFERGCGEVVLKEVEWFARDILNREQLDLLSLNNRKLIHYYKRCGFLREKGDVSKDTYRTRFMYKPLTAMDSIRKKTVMGSMTYQKQRSSLSW